MTVARSLDLSPETLLNIYRSMELIRTFEDRFKELVETGAPLDGGHACVGPEEG